MNKKLIHFDTTFNSNPHGNYYQDCVLPLASPIKKLRSIALKSVEMPLVIPPIQGVQTNQTIPLHFTLTNPVYAISDSVLNFLLFIMQPPPPPPDDTDPGTATDTTTTTTTSSDPVLVKTTCALDVSSLASSYNSISHLLSDLNNLPIMITDENTLPVAISLQFTIDPVTNLISTTLSTTDGSLFKGYTTWTPCSTLTMLGLTGKENVGMADQSYDSQQADVTFGHIPVAQPGSTTSFNYTIPINSTQLSYGDMNTLVYDVNLSVSNYIASHYKNAPTISIANFKGYTAAHLADFPMTFSVTNNKVQVKMIPNSFVQGLFGSSIMPYYTLSIPHTTPLLTLLGFSPGITSQVTTTQQIMTFPNPYQLSLNTYVNLYFSNVPIPSAASASGINSTFKIPLNNDNQIMNISNVIGNQSLNVYYYTEENAFVQKVQVSDHNYVFDRLKLSVFDRTGNYLSTFSTPLAFSFTLEVEYE